MQTYPSIKERFYSGITLTPTCFLWSRSLTTDGYGQIKLKGKAVLVHRLAWRIFYGVWPTKSTLHRCDVRNCVRPDHLYLGTQKDNMRDRHKARYNRVLKVIDQMIKEGRLDEADLS